MIENSSVKFEHKHNKRNTQNYIFRITIVFFVVWYSYSDHALQSNITSMLNLVCEYLVRTEPYIRFTYIPNLEKNDRWYIYLKLTGCGLQRSEWEFGVECNVALCFKNQHSVECRCKKVSRKTK